MNASLRTLLTRIIDYAGLFPPAKLEMDPMVRNYASYMNSEDGWMLGRVIVPVSRLDEFEDVAGELLPPESDPKAEPWQISAIMAGGDADQIAREIERIEAFNIAHEDGFGLAVIDVVEVRAESAEVIDRVLNALPPDLFPFFELSIDTDPRGLIAALGEGEAGAKVRTGGTSPELYPRTEDLARFIRACASAGVPFKATAGLHHPLVHQSTEINVREFGFLNVFIAGCFALTHELDDSDLVKILKEQSLDAFKFTENGLRWRDELIRTANIEDVREEFAVSFGSCSFDEPLGHLRAMRLL